MPGDADIPNAQLPKSPVAAEASCPATGARAMGRVLEIRSDGARLVFADPAARDRFDVGATIDCNFISSALGGSQTLRGRVHRRHPDGLELAFVSRAGAPLESLFKRRSSLRINSDRLPETSRIDLVIGNQDPTVAALEDLSMNGATVVLHDIRGAPRADERARMRLGSADGLMVWMSGSVRHVEIRNRTLRLGIEFDRRTTDADGAGPALRELVRQLEKAQVDQLMLAHEGIATET